MDGTTALHWAVHNDNADLVERLIDAGANVNASNQLWRNAADGSRRCRQRRGRRAARGGRCRRERTRQGWANALDGPGARQQRRRGTRAARARRRRQRTRSVARPDRPHLGGGTKPAGDGETAARARRRSRRPLRAAHVGPPDLGRETPPIQAVRGAHCPLVRGPRRLRRMRAGARRRRRRHRSIGLSRHHARHDGARQLSLRPRRLPRSRPGQLERMGLVGPLTAVRRRST